MKGKATGGVKAKQDLNSDFYAGAGSNVAKESKDKAEGFKKGGKIAKMMGDKAKGRADRKPRKSGGKVLSTASSGTPRGKASHY